MKKELTLSEILKEFHTISGFRMSLYDIHQHEIISYPEELTSFCSFIQQSKKGKRLCVQYDSAAFSKARETGETCIYKCHCGLYEAVAPLYHFGMLSGYLMMGQTIDLTTTSKEQVYQQSLSCCSDYDALKKAVETIPSRSKNQILSSISIMEICAEYITLTSSLKDSSKDLPERLRAYLNQNFSSNILLDDLCSIFYCSRSTLTSSFRKAYGETIVEYLTRIRLKHGVRLLTETDFSVSSISAQCGFSSQNYFTKALRKAYGKTPSQIRNGT